MNVSPRVYGPPGTTLGSVTRENRPGDRLHVPVEMVEPPVNSLEPGVDR